MVSRLLLVSGSVISIVHLPWSQKNHQKPDNKNFQTSCSRSTSTSFAEGTSILIGRYENDLVFLSALGRLLVATGPCAAGSGYRQEAEMWYGYWNAGGIHMNI